MCSICCLFFIKSFIDTVHYVLVKKQSNTSIFCYCFSFKVALIFIVRTEMNSLPYHRIYKLITVNELVVVVYWWEFHVDAVETWARISESTKCFAWVYIKLQDQIWMYKQQGLWIRAVFIVCFSLKFSFIHVICVGSCSLLVRIPCCGRGDSARIPATT
jgi:hypothetical protein